MIANAMAKNAKALKILKIFLPFKQGVRSSSLRWVTKKKDTCFASVLLFLISRVMHAPLRRGIELARRKSSVRRELWREKEHV